MVLDDPRQPPGERFFAASMAYGSTRSAHPAPSSILPSRSALMSSSPTASKTMSHNLDIGNRIHSGNSVIHFTHSCRRKPYSPSNAESAFVLSTRMQRFFKNHLTLSCWYSLDSIRRVLSDAYPCARVSIIFLVDSHYFTTAKLATSIIKFKLHDRKYSF